MRNPLYFLILFAIERRKEIERIVRKEVARIKKLIQAGADPHEAISSSVILTPEEKQRLKEELRETDLTDLLLQIKELQEENQRLRLRQSQENQENEQIMEIKNDLQTLKEQLKSMEKAGKRSEVLAVISLLVTLYPLMLQLGITVFEVLSDLVQTLVEIVSKLLGS